MTAGWNVYRTWMVIALVLSGGMSFAQERGLQYFRTPLIDKPVAKVVALPRMFGDSAGYDTLYQAVASEGTPVSYHRVIKTSVCFDGQCRLLDMELYWNPTGTYLGFRLPAGEFLSKAEHEPFTNAEYEKLHTILGDSISPLGDYRLEELVPRADSSVDGLSAATLKEVTDYIVPGALFTTYRLWHLVYGETRSEISRCSALLMNASFARAILRSGAPGDQVWALNHLQLLPRWTEELASQVTGLIGGNNLNVTERAIAAVGKRELADVSIQRRLGDSFAKGDHVVRKLLLDKLREAPGLDPAVAEALSAHLPSLNGELLGGLLELYKQQEVRSPLVLQQITRLLDSPNRYIRQKALAFMKEIKPGAEENRR